MDMEIVKSTQLPISEIMTIGKAFVESGMFPDTRSAAQAVVKIQAGQEIGIAPFAAMTGIHIIQGRPTVGAGLIASKVKSSGKYDYKVIEMTDKICSLDFYQGKNKIGNSTFTIEDARKAQTKNIEKFPKNMLFARAISNGVKWFTPDVFNGPVYTPEDMDVKTEDVPAEVTTSPANNEQMDRVYDVVNTPSDIEQEVKTEIPGHWYAKLEKCATPEDVDELGKKHAETINANPDLRKLFVERKTELKKHKTNPLPF